MTRHHSELLQYADDVWRLIVRVLGNCDDAQDCFQQTFADALCVKKDTVRSWRGVLCTIATRRTMDVLRQRYGGTTVDSNDLDQNHTASPLQDDLDYQELRRTVRQVLANMPTLQASAFVLRHLDEMSIADIADQLNVTQGHVRVLVHRAAAQLRTDLPKVFRPNHLQSTCNQR